MLSESHQVMEQLRNLSEFVHKKKKQKKKIRKGETHLCNEIRNKVNRLFCNLYSCIHLQKLSCSVDSELPGGQSTFISLCPWN